MKLYYSPGACSLAPHIIACEAGLPVELVKVDLESKLTETGDDYRLLNPHGYVPLLLLDDGSKLTEVAAIVQYFAGQPPERNLIPPEGTFERYQVQQWLNFVATEIHKNFSPLFNPAMPGACKKLAVDCLEKRFKTVEALLAEQEYLLGENFTVADAYLFVTLSWGQYVDVDLSRWPALEKFSDRIAARPAVQQAMRKEGLVG